MNKIPTIKSERLILRPFRLTDAPHVQRLAGDKAIADTTLAIPHPYPDGAAESWIKTHHELFAQGKELHFAIERRDDGRLLGAIGLVNIEPDHQAELGYWIGREYWKQGYATEAARQVINYAFSRLGLRRVHAGYLARNPASGRVLEKIGMTREGIRRNHLLKWGKPEDLVLVGILKSDV